MLFPQLHIPRQSRLTISRFLGLDRRERGEAGSFAAMENLWADGYPALQTRPGRALAARLDAPGGLTAKDSLIWVDGHTLYVGGSAVGAVLSEGAKQLVSMGAYLLVFPDKVWVNTADLSRFGYLENRADSTGTVSMTLCRPDGSGFDGYLTSAQPPEEPESGALWLDISGDAPVLRRYGESGWTAVEEVCVAISARGIGVGFAAGDGVTVSGCEAENLNGSAVLELAEDDRVVIRGVIAGSAAQEAAVTLRRTVPDMDFVVECGNRLWGCRYGMAEGRAVNEIYASKLGDFKNWQCYAGLSTDSYAAARGTDGPFTGAAAYLGSPLFFKEQCIERVYPSAAGAHQIVTLHCPGVKRGSHASLATVDGTLYYHGPGGIYAFDGSLPRLVSAQLDEPALEDAVAGARQGQYWLSAREGEARHLLVYDSRLGLWHRQDDLAVMAFALHGESLYALEKTGGLWDLQGINGEAEQTVPFLAESGDLGLDSAHHKDLRRLTVQLQLEAGRQMRVACSADGGKTWEKALTVRGTGGLQHVTLPLPRRRSAAWRLRLSGSGACTVYSVSAVYEKGSEW